MVCLGNICRSPLAEELLATKLPKDKFIVDSAGTGNYHIGKQPDQRSVLTAQKNGLDISNQKARQFTSRDFDDFECKLWGFHEGNNYVRTLVFVNEETKQLLHVSNSYDGKIFTTGFVKGYFIKVEMQDNFNVFQQY